MITQPAKAQCPKGFARPSGGLRCEPVDKSDRAIWEACGAEPERYGLFESEPCMSSHSREALTAKFLEYCRRSKLPHLYKQTK